MTRQAISCAYVNSDFPSVELISWIECCGGWCLISVDISVDFVLLGFCFVVFEDVRLDVCVVRFAICARILWSFNGRFYFGIKIVECFEDFSRSVSSVRV